MHTLQITLSEGNIQALVVEWKNFVIKTFSHIIISFYKVIIYSKENIINGRRIVPSQKKISYSIAYKKNVLIKFKGKSTRQIVLETGIPRSTIRSWYEQETGLMETKRSKKKPSLGGQGRIEMIPFSQVYFLIYINKILFLLTFFWYILGICYYDERRKKRK